MKKNVLGTILISLLVAIFVHLAWPQSVASINKEGSTLERIKRTGQVRCGYTPWPPFWEVDANTGKSKGLTLELSDRFFELAGWKPEYIEVASGSEGQDLQSGKIDMMCGAGPWSIGTIKEINYTTPYYYGAVYVWGRAGETRFKKMVDLNSPEARFVGMDGDLSIDLVQRSYPKAHIQSLGGITDPSQLMLNVATRKADLVIIDAISATNFNKTNNVQLVSLFPDQPMAVYGGGFAIKKGDLELLETINGLTGMMNNMNIPANLIAKYGLANKGLLPAARTYQ